MKLSLVMATRNRAGALRHFLERLAGMEPPKDWEIVIADNGSEDGTGPLLLEFGRRLPLKTTHVPVPGKSRALNAALGLVTGDLVLFTDDDVEPQADWLSQWLDGAERYPQYTVFGGRIQVEETGVPQWIMRSGNLQEMLVSLHDLGNEECAYPSGRYPIGPNMAVRRDALVAANAKWPENLGPGTPVPLGDERAFLGQISAPGKGDRFYLTRVQVFHHPDIARLTRLNCWKRCFLGGLAAGRIGRREPRSRFPAKSASATLLLRVRQCRSFSEWIAISLRALGVLAGRLGR